MWADFIAPAAEYDPFARALNNYPHVILGPMNWVDLRNSILSPARKMNVELEQGLTERILQDLGEEPGTLPLQAFALSRLWELQARSKITYDAYENIGGVKKELACHADESHVRFNTEQQGKLRRIFLQLIRPGEGANDTRQMATRKQTKEENWNVVTKMADERLAAPGSNIGTGGETVLIDLSVKNSVSEEQIRDEGIMVLTRIFMFA